MYYHYNLQRILLQSPFSECI